MLDLARRLRQNNAVPRRPVRYPRTSPPARGGRATRQVVGVAWYGPADWSRLKEVVPDAERLEHSHAKWEEVALDSCAKLAAAGVHVVRIHVDADEFLAWCRGKRRAGDAAARAHFAAEKLRERDLAGKRGGGAGGNSTR